MVVQSSPKLNIKTSPIFGHLGDPSKFISVGVLDIISAEDIHFVDMEVLRPMAVEKWSCLKPLTCNPENWAAKVVISTVSLF
jgi:hypothetical protein